ncbi:RDD family protein [Micromonosporaceae bacterium Da 78-11]
MATPTDPDPAAPEAIATQVASFGRRFGALLIDWALSTLVASFFVADLRANPWPQLAVFVLVHAFFVGNFGQTPGMAIARIRCISIVDGGAIGIPRGLIRAVLLAIVIPAVISDGDGRGVHDRAAGSVMVRKVPSPEL